MWQVVIDLKQSLLNLVLLTLANAPEQVLAMAIRDAMRKDKDKT